MLANDHVRQRREAAIARLGLLDRAGDPMLTALCRVAAYVAGAPAAAVHVLDRDRQRRIASVGAPLLDHPRGDSMCRLVVDGEQRIVCADASLDPRFGYSSFVQGPAPVRLYVSTPLRVGDGTVVGTLCAFGTEARELSDEQVALFEDVAVQAAAQIELSRLACDLGDAASHDPLTGAVNRLVLADRLAQAFARQLRHGGRTLLAVVDLNEFKAVNDELGHAAGDAVLIEVAQRLSAAVRSEDTVARIGGDEFVVLAELPDAAGVAELVERIDRALAAPIRCGEQLRRVSASVGTVFAEPGEDVRAALARADAAMYAVKGAGRSR